MYQFFEKQLPSRLITFIQRYRRRGSDELRRERGQAILRTFLGVAISTYLSFVVSKNVASSSPPVWLIVLVGCTIASAIVTILLYRETESSATRRTWMNAVDVLAITYSMIAAGEHATPLFVLYLWVTLGNGFRFGARAMTVSAALSALGVLAVLALSPSRESLLGFAGAVFVALMLLPIYLSRFMSSSHAVAQNSPPANSPTTNALSLSLSALVKRLAPQRHDQLGREQGQAIIRVVVSLLLLVYLLVSDVSVNAVHLGFIIFAIATAAMTLQVTHSSAVRRVITSIADVAMTSYVMVELGEAGIPLFVFYLWVALGNGFRFGLRAMAFSAALSLIGFISVVLMSPVWQQLVDVAAAVTVSLIVLPLLSMRVLQKHARVDATNRNGWLSLFRVPPNSDALVRERGQAFTRLVVGAAVTAYLIASNRPVTHIDVWMWFCFAFLLFSVAIVALAHSDAQHSATRRTVANIVDVSAISYLMVSTGEAGFPLFILYLWVTLGNGFRFGLAAMTISAVLSAVGFSIAVIVSDLWLMQPNLAIGIVAGLLVIPAYAAHLIRQLHEARRRAEEASAAKSHFLARMSHELRTPLNGILGTAELLASNKRFTREDQSMLDIIKESVSVSMRQIDNVLDFSKIEAGKLAVEQVEFDTYELLSQALRLVRNIALEKGLRLGLRVDPRIPNCLIGDPHHLHEVLLNLLSNAIKFTEKGYVSLEAHLVAQKEASAVIRLEVHDTGIGIEPQALERIFEAFSQADTSTTRHYGGTGLGTTIAKQLIELMGGRLAVNSIKGKGSVFYAEIEFPRGAKRDNSSKLAGMRVLLVSQNDELQNRLGAALRTWNVSLLTVRTAEEALGLLGRSIRLANPLHVVLADGESVMTAGGRHRADSFLEKATLAFTPVFLLADVVPSEEQLRRWGYAGVLPYQFSLDSLCNAISVSAVGNAGNKEGVVQVEPWVWGQSTQPRMRVLIADDNRTNLMILKKMLETANYEVDTAENGEQALDRLMVNRYKVAILDMHMPLLDGMGVIKQYRLLRRGARTPIVMLTANATVDALMDSAEAGADAYLTKPTTASAVLGTIKRLLDESTIYNLDANRHDAPAAQDVPLLDTAVLTELDRLYNDPDGMRQVLDTFESEGRRLLDKLATATTNGNHAIFCDLAHALKGNGANVGACRLAQACDEVQGCGIVAFRRDGKQLLRRLESEFAQAAQALREFTATSGPGSARG